MKIRKFDLVVALYIFSVMTAELMGAKTFPLLNSSWGHLNASVAIFVVPLIFVIMNTVIEVYGRARARSLFYCGLVTIVLLILYAWLATSLPPSHRFAKTEPAYDAVFHSAVRISLASLTAFVVSEMMDIAFFSRLRASMKGQALWLRNSVTSFLAHFMDSFVFIFLAFYSLQVSFHSNVSFLFSLIIPYWLIRCVLSIIETPLVYAGVWWLRGTKDIPKNLAMIPKAAEQ